MLEFSTILDIDGSLTKEKFIELVIRWNQTLSRPNNIIPGIVWNEEQWRKEGSLRFGNEDLWLAFSEYEKQDIIAVRFEKAESDGVKWDTDYIMNFREGKMAIRLDRSYAEDAWRGDPNFSTPHFITLLIEDGYVRDDGELPVLREPICVTASNLELLTDVMAGKRYRLPVVYVSRTETGEEPVEVNWLAGRLKGAAHVLVAESCELDARIRETCEKETIYNGCIGVYYSNPAAPRKRFPYRRHKNPSRALLNNVVRDVIRYGNSQETNSLYTWMGVRTADLMGKLTGEKERLFAAQKDKLKAEEDRELFYEEFAELEQRVAELNEANQMLQAENQGLRAKLNKIDTVPLLEYGCEDDLYPGEIKDMVLSLVAEALPKVKGDSRRKHVLQDVFDSNGYEGLAETRQKQIKNALRNYKQTGMTAALRKELEGLGLKVSDGGKHYKVVYGGDERYTTTFSKTSSSNNVGRDMASTIIGDML